MLSAHVRKLYLNVEINKQIASIDDGIVENRGPAAKVAPLFNVFHRNIETIPIVEQHHFLHITCVDETFDVWVQLTRIAVGIVRDGAETYYV